MGIAVERPTLRKKRLMRFLEVVPKGSKDSDHDSWQWGAFQNLTIDDAMSHPTRLNPNRADVAATLESSSDGDRSSKHLISPSTAGSSPLSPLSPRSAASPSFGGRGFADPSEGNVASMTHHRRLKKRSDTANEKDLSAMMNSEWRPSRWDSGRWNGDSMDSSEKCSAARTSRGNRVCKCATGLTVDVAVVCCCPFSLLHLLAIMLVKFPAAVVSKAVTRVKKNVAAKRRRAAVAVHEEDEDSVPVTSCPPSRTRSYDEGAAVQTWAPALSFGDQKLWKDYFDSPDCGMVWSPGEDLLKGRS